MFQKDFWVNEMKKQNSTEILMERRIEEPLTYGGICMSDIDLSFQY
jgi:hypothetical protein